MFQLICSRCFLTFAWVLVGEKQQVVVVVVLIVVASLENYRSLSTQVNEREINDTLSCCGFLHDTFLVLSSFYVTVLDFGSAVESAALAGR